MTSPVYTIGHSTHVLPKFLDLVRRHELSAVADVRSSPYSRFAPHFNRAALHASLRSIGVAYAFLGDQLGARSDDPGCYVAGRVQYDRLEQTPGFAAGIARILDGARRYRVALMCAEHDPMTCHRGILVARHLAGRGIEVRHCHGDGRLEQQHQLEERLLKKLGINEPSLFQTKRELVGEAYRRQGETIAYQRPDSPGVDLA